MTALLSEGRQWIAIKNIEWLDDLQPRDGVDAEWVRTLAGFKKEGSEFPPARIYQMPSALLVAPEAFHRRGALLSLGETSMLCDVVNGSREDAISWAAGSNRSNGVKPMSNKDITKALRMLLSLDDWWKRGDTAAGKHVGCSQFKAREVRRKISDETGKEIPKTMVDEMGRDLPYRRHTKGSDRLPSISKCNGRFQCGYNGAVYSATSLEELHKALQKVFADEDSRKSSLTRSAVSGLLRVNGFTAASWSDRRFPGINGWHGHGIVACVCDFEHRNSLAISVGGIELLLATMGRLRANRQQDRHATRSIVLCHRKDGPEALIGIFEETGIEFMTPRELIASLGPCKPPRD